MSAAKNMVGDRFVRLTVTSFAGAKSGNAQWNCRCDCGKDVTVSRPNLLSGNTQSCGCLNSECSSSRRSTHRHTAGRGSGKRPSRTYSIWGGMISRCRHHQSYAGRGIGVCERWHSFENFLGDMGEAPSGCSIDRINNNLGYSPDNCRWSTPTLQSRNRRSSRIITYCGVSITLAAWAEFTKLSSHTISHAIDRAHVAAGVALGFE